MIYTRVILMGFRLVPGWLPAAVLNEYNFRQNFPAAHIVCRLNTSSPYSLRLATYYEIKNLIRLEWVVYHLPNFL